MKNVVYISLIFIFAACSNSDNSVYPPPSDPISEGTENPSHDEINIWYEYFANSWIEEVHEYDQNGEVRVREEVSYSKDGTFKDVITHSLGNVMVSIEGNYQVNSEGTNLIETFVDASGTNSLAFKIISHEEMKFVIASSDGSSHVYERIVESYNLKHNEIAEIQFSKNNDYVVLSYESSNSFIASVNKDGVIIAGVTTGYAYIKVITDKGNIWIKVINDSEQVDSNETSKFGLDYDFSIMLGATYEEMIGKWGTLTSDFENNYSYMTDNNEQLESVNVTMNTETNVIKYVTIFFRNSQSKEDILNYLESRFYYNREFGNRSIYIPAETLEESRYTVSYDKAMHSLIYMIRS